MLPLGPPDRYGSPYKARSAFAAWPGLLADPDAPVSGDEADAFRERESYWIEGWIEHGGRGALEDQVRFDREWSALRAYAAERGVRLVGDVPIYVAPGGADHRTWPELFRPGCRPGCRRTPSPRRASSGGTRSSTGPHCTGAATGGGSSGCGARSRWST